MVINVNILEKIEQYNRLLSILLLIFSRYITITVKLFLSHITLTQYLLLSSYPKVCLTNRVCDHDTTPLEDVEVEYDMTHPPSLDDQCRRAYGPDSYNCAPENVS